MKNNSDSTTLIRYVYWTSGWDSTYMVIKLLRDGYTVQPIYIINPRRKSRQYELIALNYLTEHIPHKIKTGLLLPYQVFPFPHSSGARPEKSALRRICHQSWHLGTQYIYLAQFAREHHTQFPIISLGIEKVPKNKIGGAHNTIDRFGKMGSDQRIDQEHSSSEIKILFGNYDFPISDVTEEEMLKNIRQWGCEDLMKHTWFCHRPISGQPCGFCPPCFQKYDSDMKFMLSKEAIRRHDKFYVIQQKYGPRIKKLCDMAYHFFGFGKRSGIRTKD